MGCMSSVSNDLKNYCYNIPKAELHIHIEGTFEPELIFKIAERNNMLDQLTSKSVEELRNKYKFKDLQSFLDIYYEGCKVLIKKEDFSDLSYAYGVKAYGQGLKYAEIFFDPQSHLPRGVSFETLITGLREGLDKIKKEHNDFNYNLIMCFLRHLPENDAIDTLNAALPFKDKFFAVGLDSGEKGNPPENFKNVYATAKSNGFHLVAHAGEEGPAEYIKNSLDILEIERIDHGNHIMDDEELINRVVKEQKPLTLCPLSNQKLQVCPDLSKHPIRKMMNKGLLVMVNSDDPSYFGGYIGDNYFALVQYLDFNYDEIYQLAINSFKATFLNNEQKDEYIKMVEKFKK